MKTVFNNRQLAHVWAQQTQSEGRSSSMRFSGDTIYSYETPIAKIYFAYPPSSNTEGTRFSRAAVLISNNGHSQTSKSKHYPAVRAAVQHLLCFTVPFIGAPGGRNRPDSTNMEEVHTGNMAAFFHSFQAALDDIRSIRIRKQYAAPSVWATSIALSARRYANAFSISQPSWCREHDAVASVSAASATGRIAREEYEARQADPKYKAKREAAAARRAARKAAREAEKAAKALSDWRIGAPCSQRLSDAEGGALLRVRGGEVHTSWGAQVPTVEAMSVIPRLLALRDELAREAAANNAKGYGQSVSIRVGGFSVNDVSNKGIKAGCHIIHWAEIEGIMPALGLGAPL